MSSNGIIVVILILLVVVALPAASGNYTPLYIGGGVLLAVVLLGIVAALRNPKVEQEEQSADGETNVQYMTLNSQPDPRLAQENEIVSTVSNGWKSNRDGTWTNGKKVGWFDGGTFYTVSKKDYTPGQVYKVK